MKKTLRTFAFGAVLIGATAFVTAQVTTSQQDPGQPESPFTPEQMQRWKEASTPGENHEKLNHMVGKWDYTMKMWMDPSSEPMESTGTVSYEWILDNHHIQGDYQGEWMGETFKGRELFGYDNMDGQYFSIWLDNMSTTFMTMHGNHQGENKMVMTGVMDDCMTGRKDVKHRSVTTKLSPTQVKIEMFYNDEQGKEVKGMEILSTKRG